MSTKNEAMLIAAYEAAQRGAEVAIVCESGVVWMKFAVKKVLVDNDWLEQWREHNPPIDEKVPVNVLTQKLDAMGHTVVIKDEDEACPFGIDVDYLVKIRDSKHIGGATGHEIRELARRLHEVIVRVHEMETDYP